MYNQKKKINRNRIFGIIILALSVLLLTIFTALVTKEITLINNVYEAKVFTFIFGSLGLVTSIALLFVKD